MRAVSSFMPTDLWKWRKWCAHTLEKGEEQGLLFFFSPYGSIFLKALYIPALVKHPKMISWCT